MKIVNERPPQHIWDEAHVRFPIDGLRPIFAYGDTIYNPYGRNVDAADIAHEEVHSRQQGTDPDGWWERYFYDMEFRYSQEVEAYAAQYAFAKRMTKNREMLARALHALATDLSSEAYGGMVSYQEARAAIVDNS